MSKHLFVVMAVPEGDKGPDWSGCAQEWRRQGQACWEMRVHEHPRAPTSVSASLVRAVLWIRGTKTSLPYQKTLSAP